MKNTGERVLVKEPTFLQKWWQEKNEYPQYRHEYKYVVTQENLVILKSRIRYLVPQDSHVKREGKYCGIYNIRSLYFDTILNRCYLENENGTDPREKFRIRIYNHSDKRITLELKQKVNGKCRKLSCPLTREQCQSLMHGKLLPVSCDYPPVLQKLLLQMKTELLRPVVIVEYERMPFVYKNGNVRVTFDMDIRSCDQVEKFLDDEIPYRLIMPMNQHILEVKWDQYIPDFIKSALELNQLQWTSFSKYYLCRKFSLGLVHYKF